MAEVSLENNVRLEKQVSVIETKVDMFIEEMREQTRQRIVENREMREKHDADMKKMEDRFASIDQKFSAIDQKFENLENYMRSMSTAVMVGVGAMVVSMTAAVVGMFYTIFTK